MKFGKGKKEEKKKPIKVVKVKLNEGPTMWCRKHGCTKLACPGGMHN